MGLKNIIQENLKAAMKNKQPELTMTLRSITSKITEAEKANGNKELSDADVVKVIAKGVKERKGSIELYNQGGREDLAKKEEAEIAILEEYLPKAMGVDEIRTAVSEIIASNTYTKADMGKVMKEFSSKYEGQDGKLVSTIVRELL